MMASREGQVVVREIECRSALNRSGLSDYCLNCYRSCEHACCYCYARYMMKFIGRDETWGSFVDVKINAPEVLARQVKKAKRGRVFISSVCDGWQPREEKYGLTGECLKIFRRAEFPVTVLTKSALVRRDLDLLAKMDGAELGCTLTAMDPALKRIIEPGSSSTEQRIAVLEEARRKKIRIYAFLGPLLPYLTDTETNLSALLAALKDLEVDYFYLDRLNLRFQVWPAVSGIIRRHYPELTEKYRRIFFEKERETEYVLYLKNLARRLAKKFGVAERMNLCF